MDVRITGNGRRYDGQDTGQIRYTLRVSSSDVTYEELRERVVEGLKGWPAVDNVDWTGRVIEFDWAAPYLSDAHVWTEVGIWLDKLAARWPAEYYEPA